MKWDLASDCLDLNNQRKTNKAKQINSSKKIAPKQFIFCLGAIVSINALERALWRSLHYGLVCA